MSCAVLALLAVAVACQEPTQITARITTTVPCDALSDVNAYVGPTPRVTEGRFKDRVSTGVTDQCAPDGFIGTLVVTPGEGSGTILVATGVRSADGTPAPVPEACFEIETSKRCIIARRTFSFIENKPLKLPINLDPLCVGTSCDPSSTCYKGQCVSAEVICVGDDCGLREENPGARVPTGPGNGRDGGSSGGPNDGSLTDAPYGEDGSVSDGSLNDGTASSDSGVNTVDGGQLPPYCMFIGNGDFRCEAPGYGNKTFGTCMNNTQPASFMCCRCTCPGPVLTSCQAAAAQTGCEVVCP